MQFTHVPRENDRRAPELKVGDATFRRFVERHEELERAGIWVQPELAETIHTTYVMIDPAGRVFQDGPDGHRFSRPVLDIGLEQAIEEAGGYDRARFLDRGGDVDIRRLPLVGGLS